MVGYSLLCMRKEPFTVGDYVHVYNRGAKKLPIVKDKRDQWRFLKLLRHINDVHVSEHWESEIEQNVQTGATLFERPTTWRDREPLVSILAYTLMPNHFHLLVREVIDGGLGKFMQKFGNSMTGHFNLKYKESGSLFQGSYKAKRVDKDLYFRQLAAYIMVKNVLELYPGGFDVAIKDFNKAYSWATEYQFSSFVDYASAQVRPAQEILEKDLLGELFQAPQEFKAFAKDFIVSKKFEDPDIQRLLVD